MADKQQRVDRTAIWVAVLIGIVAIVVVILVSLPPASDTHVPPQQKMGGAEGEEVVDLSEPMPSDPVITLEPGAEREGAMTDALSITSSAFENTGTIPTEYTADGRDVNPPLAFSGVPAGAKSLVLIMDDPDAPVGTWDHWIVWNIPPDTREIAAGSMPAGAVRGANGWGRSDYGGPSPPSGTHRYFFKLYALDTTLDLKAGAKKAAVEQAMEGHILTKAELVGVYSRGR
jgi:Raf kinase inhibitor-like YbhB/YbcL family protein